MASKSLTFDLYGRDKSASKTMDKLGRKVDNTGDRFKRFGKVAAVGIAVAAAAIVKFGSDSVQAYADAEDSQNRLEYAWKKFPKAASVPLQAIRDLNTELMKKTRFDDDAIAVGQAQLAQYKLTGEQIQQLTPLMLDYAAKTGKDVPTAAGLLGKALLGQGRALKDIGVDFTDTGSLAGNFDQLIGGLRGQVKGFAEQDATTASGKLENLQNRFGEVQEKVGEALMPALEDLMDFLEKDGMPVIEDLAGFLSDDIIPAVKDVTGAFNDFNESTKFLQGLGDYFKGLGNFWSTAMEGIANPSWLVNDDELNKMTKNATDRGGWMGDFFKWTSDFDKGWQDWWDGLFGTAQTGSENVRKGMGGGFSRAGMDNKAFRDEFKARWGESWSATEARTSSGMGSVVRTTGTGLLNTLAQAAGFSSRFGGQWSGTWATANSLTRGGWSNIEGSTRAGVGRVGGQVGRVRGVVQSPFAGVASWLTGSGEALMGGFIDGINGMRNAVGGAVNDVLSWARGFFPNSPAKRGVFSGSGWMSLQQSGEAVMSQWYSGINGSPIDFGGAVDRLVSAPVALNTTQTVSAAMPQTMVLRVGDREFTAYVEHVSGGVVAGYDKQSSRAIVRGARP